MKISIIGGGNMGGAIAKGLAISKKVPMQDITIINRSDRHTASFKSFDKDLQVAINNYESLSVSNIVILAVKPWLIEEVLKLHCDLLKHNNPIIVSVASSISLAQLEEWTSGQTLFRVMPNTAIAMQQSMTFVTSKNASEEEIQTITDLFKLLGKVEVIEEKLFAAATSLASCGIAFALRYIRAAMEGGVEMGFYPDQARDTVVQTLRGAIELLETNRSHPEAEIDKVTTAGGITIKGLNEMEHAGFTSAIIRGLKASNI